MDYARQVYEILTAPPDPEISPGHLGDDWIDRSDGYGTDVKVTAIAVVPGDLRHIHDHIRAHEPSRDDDRDLPARAEQHAMLLEVLGREGQVEQQAPNRYVVRREEREDLIVLLTPDQWERAIRRHGPRRAWLLEHFNELFASTPPEERFLVFWEGDVATSTREKLPPAKRPFPPLRETQRRLAEARASGRDFGWSSPSS